MEDLPPVTFLTTRSLFDEQYKRTAAKLAALLTHGILHDAVKPFEVRAFQADELGEAFKFLGQDGESKFWKPKVVVEVGAGGMT